MTSYKAVGKFEKLGEEVLTYGELAASLFTPFVPSDGQKYLEKKTGVRAHLQTMISGAAEIVEGIILTFVAPDTLPILYICAPDWAVRTYLIGLNNKSSASLAVEVPYQIGKAIRKGVKNYFSDLYKEAKHEVELEKGY